MVAWVHFIDFPSLLTTGATFVASYVHKPLLKWIHSKRKAFGRRWSKLFPFRVDNLSEGKQK